MASGENEIEITVDVDKPNVEPLENAFKRIMGSIAAMAEGVDRSTNRARDSLGRFISHTKKAGDSLNTYTDANGRLRDSMGRFVKSTDEAGDSTGGLFSKITGLLGPLGNLGQGGQFASMGMGLLSANAYTLVAVLPAVAGGLLALAPALLAAGGAAGAATTALAGAGVALLTLKVGLGGVGDAWSAYTQQAKAGGGGSAAAGKQAEAAAKAVENAEYSLTQAKRQAAQASKDLTKAREDERLRLINLSLSIRSQKFAEADAADEVQKAENALAQARAYGSEEGIKAAQEELDKAKLRYDIEHEKMLELAADQKKADKDGIEGSDQVTAAKERQRDANEQVARAAEALADAQKQVGASAGGAAGGINAFNEAMKKLSPNARDFVREMISVSERFDKIKKQTQDRLFAGLDKTLEDLAQKWLPKLGPMLGGMADALNHVLKGIGGALGNKDFMNGIMTASKAFADVLESDIGPAIDHIIHAFGELAGGSTEPFKEIGGWINKIATRFDEWISSATKSGKLKTFMHDAADTLGQIWDIGKKAFGIVGQFIGILFNQSKEKGGSTLDSISETLDKISDWLKDPKNQKQIQKVEDGIFQWADAFGQVLGALNDLKGAAGPIFKIIDVLLKGEVLQLKLVKGVWDAIVGVIKWIGNHGPGMWDGIKNGFKAAMNWIIDRWNSLHFTIPSFSLFGTQIGGGSIGVTPIKHFAAGGAGGGWAMAGEYGPELVRLPSGSSVRPAANTRQELGGQGSARLSGVLKLDVQRGAEQGLIRELMRLLRAEIGTYYGGSAEAAFSRG